MYKCSAGLKTEAASRFSKVEQVYQSFPQRAAQLIAKFGKNLPPIAVPQRDQVVLPFGLTETPCMYVDNERGLREVVDDLAQVSEFSVDVEHATIPGLRAGHVCLVQIGTDSKDYIIDVTKCHRWVFLLRPYFLKPQTTKVLHGSDMDLRWLMKHFGIYICNLFDTSIAMRQLCLPKSNLGYMLQHYCGIAVDKSLAKNDWSVRPISPKMLAYARTDVHYLAYCKQRLICDLDERKFPEGILRRISSRENCTSDLVRNVQTLSHHLCMKAYEIK